MFNANSGFFFGFYFFKLHRLEKHKIGDFAKSHLFTVTANAPSKMLVKTLSAKKEILFKLAKGSVTKLEICTSPI